MDLDGFGLALIHPPACVKKTMTHPVLFECSTPAATNPFRRDLRDSAGLHWGAKSCAS